LGEAPEQKRPQATEVCFSAHGRKPEAVYARRFAQDLVEFREIFGLGSPALDVELRLGFDSHAEK
jgi:hypothetical protein